MRASHHTLDEIQTRYAYLLGLCVQNLLQLAVYSLNSLQVLLQLLLYDIQYSRDWVSRAVTIHTPDPFID